MSAATDRPLTERLHDVQRIVDVDEEGRRTVDHPCRACTASAALSESPIRPVTGHDEGAEEALARVAPGHHPDATRAILRGLDAKGLVVVRKGGAS